MQLLGESKSTTKRSKTPAQTGCCVLCQPKSLQRLNQIQITRRVGSCAEPFPKKALIKQKTRNKGPRREVLAMVFLRQGVQPRKISFRILKIRCVLLKLWKKKNSNACPEMALLEMHGQINLSRLLEFTVAVRQRLKVLTKSNNNLSPELRPILAVFLLAKF